jgi:anthranilate/para-aminobenzoate synthase component I
LTLEKLPELPTTIAPVFSRPPLRARTREGFLASGTELKDTPSTPPQNEEVQHTKMAPDLVASPVERVREAIAAGKCQASVRSIRTYLSCSQTQAAEIRTAL